MKASLHGFSRLGTYIKANDLLHTHYIHWWGEGGAWYKQQLVTMDGMFKNGISWNIGKCELGWFSFRQSHFRKSILIIKNYHKLFMYLYVLCPHKVYCYCINDVLTNKPAYNYSDNIISYMKCE